MGTLKDLVTHLEFEKEQVENEQDYQDFIDNSKVTVGLRMSAYDAEMLRLFAQKYNKSVSSLGSEMMAIAIREAIKELDEDVSDWLQVAGKNLQEKSKKQ